MKVLVTGAGGFIGSHLCEALVSRGYSVKAFVRYNSQNLWGWLEDSPIKDDIEVIAGDIRDFDSVLAAVSDAQIVFHLAALISIPYSYRSQQAFVDVNTKGTLNVLQASLMSKVEKIVHTSTSEVYGTAQYVPIDEKHPVNPQSPYAATKAGADYLALSFYRSFGLPVAIARPFNTFGPRQSARAVIPTIITQLFNNKKQIKLGSLKPTRDFTYVKDTAAGFIEISKSGKLVGEITNIGMAWEISMGELFDNIASLMTRKARVVQDKKRLRPKMSEVKRLFCDNKKLIANTAWKPEYSFKKGLKETVEWFSDRENLKKYKSGLYNI